MSDPSHKGHFSTDIAQQVIDEALRCVTGRKDSPPSETAAPEPSPGETELLEEKWHQAVADLEDYKKRARKEKEELQRYGVEKLLRDFLPVADNLDRALEHARARSDFESLRQGLEMTRKLLKDALAKNGVVSFSAAGTAFDPQRHEAVGQVESADVPPSHVLTEVSCGYLLNGRLARPAQVIVSKPRGSGSPPAQGAERTDEGVMPR